MVLGPNSNILTSGYQAGYGTETNCFKVTVTNSALRLKDLITNAGGTMPNYTNELYTASQGDAAQIGRPPWHVIFQVPQAAANPVYCTWDNNTAPVVGGPGLEFEPGVIYRFENAGNNLLRVRSAGIYQVNAKTAFQFIATASTSMLVTFSD